MSIDENARLKQKVALLESELSKKNSEVVIYRQELIKISQRLDYLMSQISHDLKVLSEVQKNLMPTEIPTIPGFEISRKFVFGSKHGGDYFDIFEHEDKFKFGILVASSSGYAMSALFLSLILKVSHVLEAKKGNAPDKILQQIADEIKKTAKGEDLTSAFYAVIDRRDFSLQFCSAGKVNGYYLAPHKPVQVLKSSHSAFGVQFSEKLSLATLELEPKSRICVVTEGLENVLGVENIVRIMTDNAKNGVHDLRNELLFQAQRKAGTEEPIRDQTVVVIEVKDRVIKLAK
ncbi:PP2C family protein-serine/threonine phosphatase [Pseudobdellovibrio exovorus]|uniref:SigmaB regulation protein RsbU n=1 Tax=Pseudobdellovibrio exovorus JSS TaxID=1184267 RepID=M4VSY4_9BACT|nr:SpoIIE family protein phosphatase [Pseudobdellovibrio exovorus]AGH96319.1 sigmaB regulation protein RsbU [Pseudobdellovibrio exovorus JSS]